ncbi:MAG TPA: phage tail tape measure protein [Bacteroidales bacterium]|nr:phage tail tape measure protein [Bacteroidales bacterium]
MSAINETARVRVELDGQQAGQALEKLREKAGQLSQELHELRKANDLVGYTQKQKELRGVEAQMRSYQKAVVDTTQVLRNLNGASLKDLQMAKRELTAQIRSLNRASADELALYKQKQASLKAVNAEISRVNSSMYAQQGFLTRAAEGFNRYFGMISTVTAALAGLYMSMRQMLTLSRDYEKSLDGLSAATGLAGEDLVWLSEEAKVMSTQIVEGSVRITRSAADILEAYKLLASAKPELMEVKEDLASVTKETLILAEASEMDLEKAVMSMTTIMNQYGAGADQARKYINALAAGSKYGAAFIPQIAASLKEFGVNAATANISVEQSVGLIETLAEKGLMESRAGIMLRNVLSKLEQQSDELRPSIVGLEKALENLDARHLSVAERVKMFGERNQVAAEILTQNIDKVKYYSQVVTGTNAAIEQATINTDNASSAIEQARNRLSLMAMDLGQKIQPYVAKSINSFANLVKILANLPEFYQKNKTAILSLAAATMVLLGNKIRTAAVMVTQNLLLREGIGLRLKDAIALKAAILQEEYLAFAKAKGTRATNVATLAAFAFNKALAANPIGVVVTAITALVGAIKLYDTYSAESIRLEKEKEQALSRVKEANEKLSQSYARQAEAIGEFTKLSIEQRGALVAQVDKTLELAEAELILMQTRRQAIAQDNFRLNTWQKFVSLLLGSNAAMYEAVKSVENSTQATQELDTGIEELMGKISQLREQKLSLDDIVNAETNADAIATETLANIEEKIRLYQVALKNAAYQSEDFYRILAKIKDAEKIQASLQIEIQTETGENTGGQQVQQAIDQVQQAIDSFHQQAYLNTLSANERELEAIRDKYDKYIVMAADNHRQVQELEVLRDQELEQKANEQSAQSRQRYEDLLGEKDQFLSELHQKSMDDRSRELAENQNQWNAIKSQLDMFHSQGVISDEQYFSTLMNVTRLGREDQRKINAEYDQKEIQANQAKNKAITQANQEALMGTLTVFSSVLTGMQGLFDEQSEEFRALAIFQATLDTWAAAVAAYKSTVEIPIVGTVLAPIAAAAAVAFGMAKVAKISTASYQKGGYTGEGSREEVAGVVHKNEYVVPSHLMENPMVKAYIKEIESLRSMKGYMDGGYVEDGTYAIAGSMIGDPRIKRARTIMELLTEHPLAADDTMPMDAYLGMQPLIEDMQKDFVSVRQLIQQRDELLKSPGSNPELLYDEFSEKISRAEATQMRIEQVMQKRDRQIIQSIRYLSEQSLAGEAEGSFMPSEGFSRLSTHTSVPLDRSMAYQINNSEIRGINVPSARDSLHSSPVTPVVNIPEFPPYPQQQTPAELMDMLGKLLKKLDDPIQAHVSWWDIKKKNDDFDRIRKAVGV